MKDKKLLGLIACLTMACNTVSAERPEASGLSVPSPNELPFVCGGKLETHDGYGPYDYTNYEHYTTKLEGVESHHFTYEVEALMSGVSGSLFSELDYTLYRFPNHHRALASLSRFEFVVENPDAQIEEHKPVDCYFQRAMLFKPDDGMVRLIYATYLHRKGVNKRDDEFLSKAKEQYGYALQLMPASAEVHYNMSLYYLDVNNLTLAAEHGQKAYQLGFPLPGLKDKLKKKGLWNNTVSLN